MAEKEVRLIDANKIVEVAEHAYHEWTLAMVGADDTRTVNQVFKKQYLCKVVKAIAENCPTIDPESLKTNKRMLPLDEVYRVIAGHSNYSGDAILSALTCIAEGKAVKPVRPLESLRPHGKWVDAREYCGDYMCSNCHALYRTNKHNYCPTCGAKMEG